MFFTKTARIVAFLMFGLGVLRVAMGAMLAFGTDTMANNEAAARQILAASNTGEAINEGMLYILAAIALGVLSEISRNTSARSEKS